MSERLFRERLGALIAAHETALTPELQRAARWAEAHPAALCFESVRSSAASAGCSPSTMNRLALVLGFSGFAAFRSMLRDTLSEAAREGFVERLDAQTRAEQSADVELLRDNAASALQRNSAAAFADVAARMLNARRVVFLGLRVSFGLAFHLHYSYALVLDNGRLAGDVGGTLGDCIDELGADDLLVAISLSPYTRRTVELVARAQRRGVPVVALTDSARSPIGRLARACLLFDTGTTAFFQSLVGAQAVIELLVAELALRAGSRARERLASRQDQFTAARAYWERARRPGRAAPTEVES
jgi:DNA-binding MurR/RpiR family transcriptional regulator